jgi:hypothetical protein
MAEHVPIIAPNILFMLPPMFLRFVETVIASAAKQWPARNAANAAILRVRGRGGPSRSKSVTSIQSGAWVARSIQANRTSALVGRLSPALRRSFAALGGSSGSCQSCALNARA